MARGLFNREWLSAAGTSHRAVLILLLVAQVVIFSFTGSNFASRYNAFLTLHLNLEICLLAIALTPLSSATAILQATPIIVVLGAMAFFGETVGWRRWCAIVIGLIGVAIILRHGADDFSPLSILAVLGTLGFAGRDLASRAAPATLTTSLGVIGLYDPKT